MVCAACCQQPVQRAHTHVPGTRPLPQQWPRQSVTPAHTGCTTSAPLPPRPRRQPAAARATCAWWPGPHAARPLARLGCDPRTGTPGTAPGPAPHWMPSRSAPVLTTAALTSSTRRPRPQRRVPAPSWPAVRPSATGGQRRVVSQTVLLGRGASVPQQTTARTQSSGHKRRYRLRGDSCARCRGLRV